MAGPGWYVVVSLIEPFEAEKRAAVDEHSVEPVGELCTTVADRVGKAAPRRLKFPGQLAGADTGYGWYIWPHSCDQAARGPAHSQIGTFWLTASASTCASRTVPTRRTEANNLLIR